MDGSRRNGFDKNKVSQKKDSSARSKHIAGWGEYSKPREAKVEQSQSSSSAERQERKPLSSNETANHERVLRARNGDAYPNGSHNRDIRHITNHERFLRAHDGKPYQEDYNQHKQEIHKKLNDLEKNYNELKKTDQQLEKRFKKLSWFKQILGVDSKKNFDKCEIVFKKSRKELRDDISNLENTIKGNPGGKIRSLKDVIKLSAQDKKDFQERIDRIKLSNPKPGDKQTSRQKRFEEQESKRFQTIKENRIEQVERYRKEQSEKIDKLKEDTGRMLKESKEYMNRAARSKNAVTLFRAAKRVSDRVSLWKMGEEMQYNKVHNFPDLADKCKNIREDLKAYNKELHDTMKKKVGTQWTLRNVTSR